MLHDSRNVPAWLCRAVLTLATVGCSSQVTTTLPNAAAPDTTGSKLPAGWVAIPPAEARVGDFVIRAGTRPDSSPSGAPKGAVSYVTTATIRNTASSPRMLRLGGCAVWVTLHGGGLYYGQEARVVLSDELTREPVCPAVVPTFTLAGNESKTVTTSVFAHDLLNRGAASNSRQFFHAHLSVNETKVVVQADSATISGPSSDLASRATTSLVRTDTTQSLKTVVTLTNTGQLPAHLEYGACAVRVLAYRTADRSGPPVWDSEKRRTWQGSFGYVCLMYLVASKIPVGADFSPREFTLQVPLMEMLADSLPDGVYYFSATLGFSNRAPIGGIPAGALDLSLARPPLSTTRVADFFTYRAAPVTVSGSPAQVRAQVTATLDFAGSSLVSFSRDCPVLLYAYRDRARRDAAPRSGAADWSQPKCAAIQETVTMSKGQSRALETVVNARDILGASLPSGRYYFAVAVQAQGNRVFMSAGELDLTQ
jgi:hypothetical protein